MALGCCLYGFWLQPSIPTEWNLVLLRKGTQSLKYTQTNHIKPYSGNEEFDWCFWSGQKQLAHQSFYSSIQCMCKWDLPKCNILQIVVYYIPYTPARPLRSATSGRLAPPTPPPSHLHILFTTALCSGPTMVEWHSCRRQNSRDFDHAQTQTENSSLQTASLPPSLITSY